MKKLGNILNELFKGANKTNRLASLIEEHSEDMKKAAKEGLKSLSVVIDYYDYKLFHENYEELSKFARENYNIYFSLLNDIRGSFIIFSWVS